ncbi:MAG: hypothetical protein V3T83_04705 [Acidobacteriota bacterium]
MDRPAAGVILFGGSEGLAGVESSPQLADGFQAPMTVDPAQGINTGVAVMNLESEALTLLLELRDSLGARLASAQASLDGHGHLARFVTEFEWDAEVDFSAFRGSIQVEAAGRISAIVLLSRPGQLASLPVVVAAPQTRED